MTDVNDRILISVIVTTYNREQLLAECINAILAQTYKNFELIVVDNFSNYDFFEFLKGFKDDRIKGFQNANGGSIAMNRNVGLSKAKGKYVAFCDDDDRWHKGKLQKQFMTIERYSDTVLVSGLARKIGTATSFFGKNFGFLYRNHRLDKKTFIYNCPIILSSVLIRKSVFEKSGTFNEDLKFRAIEDLDLWLRLARHGNIRIIEELLIDYRYQSSNESGARRSQQELLVSYFETRKINHTVTPEEFSPNLLKLLVRNGMHLTLMIFFALRAGFTKLFNPNYIYHVALKSNDDYNDLKEFLTNIEFE